MSSSQRSGHLQDDEKPQYDEKPLSNVAELANSSTDCEKGIDTEREESIPDTNIVDWDGPDDPANPMNWPLSRKAVTLAMVSFMTLLAPLASTIVAPGTALVLEDFNSTNASLGAFVTSIQLIGYAVGPLIIAPMSEMYGRIPLYHVCNFIFFIFNIACALAPDLGSLIAFRFLVGIGASCPLTIGSGTLADMFPQEQRGFVMSLWVSGPILGPSLGPIAGGYLSAARGWRWTFWLLTILGGATCVLSPLVLRETYHYTLLERKAKALRKQTGNMSLRSAMDDQKSPKDFFIQSIARPLKMLFLSPIVLLTAWYITILYSYLYLCYTTFPRIFGGQYGFSSSSVSLTYLGIGVGSCLGLFVSATCSDKIVTILAARNDGNRKPEYRLPLSVIGSVLVPMGLFWYGWSAEFKEHYMQPIAATGFLGAGTVLIFMTITTFLVDAYTRYAASVIAASTVLRSIVGAVLPLAGDDMYDALGVGWGTSLLGFIAVAFVPFSLLLLKYGERIRGYTFIKVEF